MKNLENNYIHRNHKRDHIIYDLMSNEDSHSYNGRIQDIQDQYGITKEEAKWASQLNKYCGINLMDATLEANKIYQNLGANPQRFNSYIGGVSDLSVKYHKNIDEVVKDVKAFGNLTEEIYKNKNLDIDRNQWNTVIIDLTSYLVPVDLLNSINPTNLNQFYAVPLTKKIKAILSKNDGLEEREVLMSDLSKKEKRILGNELFADYRNKPKNASEYFEDADVQRLEIGIPLEEIVMQDGWKNPDSYFDRVNEI